MRLAPGTRLGRYEIRSLLGAGGMGEVYLAHDATLRRPIAIKLLSGDLARNQDRLGRFQQEAYAASSLNHPNILTIHEVGAQDGTHFIATEFIDGASLRQRMTGGRLAVREVLDIGIQIASALAAAHSAGIVHRDIKPENIMVRKDGIVKVLDFGLAKLIAPGMTDHAATTTTTAATLPGVILGTVEYMSPEQARGLETDPRTDIWSLGVVLYELLAGRPTFGGETSSDIIAAILRSDPPLLSTQASEVPRELERIVTKALQKDREERYQAVKDLGLDLKELKRRLDADAQLARSSAAVTASGDPSVVSVSPAGSTARRRVVFALLVTGAVAIVAGGYARYAGLWGGTTSRNIDSVAILPFTNESGDVENEYLSDGISETLIKTLSQLSGVKVIARSSAFKCKGKVIDPQEVARALGVEAIVTGRLSRRGESLVSPLASWRPSTPLSASVSRLSGRWKTALPPGTCSCSSLRSIRRLTACGETRASPTFCVEWVSRPVCKQFAENLGCEEPADGSPPGNVVGDRLDDDTHGHREDGAPYAPDSRAHEEAEEHRAGRNADGRKDHHHRPPH